MDSAGEGLELFRFADQGQSVAVVVHGEAPRMVSGEAFYDAAIVLESDFVRGRVRLVLSMADLDAWERGLGELEAGEGIEWPARDRSARVDVIPDDPVLVTVHDAPSTGVEVCVPVDVAEGWLEENWGRLRRVREVLSVLAGYPARDGDHRAGQKPAD
ncbi:DUF5959 family protein [Streptomyces sp. G-5]|uniref:DUF5959 family protein n=1 Tax=Streptomyces sp. G-5 TaxID=2977231 RepID=UPI0021D1BD3F|nr:DUF5959 family protein [Streptomyces sp. G-5]MCU4747045.1 DUF5959 family protein [Streptomyces sp. G-5]